MPALLIRMELPTVPAGSFRETLMPEVSRYGVMASARRFIQYSSFPVVT